MNPNVKVIEAARDTFPKDHYLYGALDHAAAELAVLHGRCQRAAVTPPEGHVLIRLATLQAIFEDAEDWKIFCERDINDIAFECFREVAALLAAHQKELK